MVYVRLSKPGASARALVLFAAAVQSLAATALPNLPCTQFAIQVELDASMPPEFTAFNGCFLTPYDGLLVIWQSESDQKRLTVPLPVMTFDNSVLDWSSPAIFCFSADDAGNTPASKGKWGPLTLPTRISDQEYAFDALYKFSDPDSNGVEPVVYKSGPTSKSAGQTLLWSESKRVLSYQASAVELGHPVKIYACDQSAHANSDGFAEPIVYSGRVLFLNWMPEMAAVENECVEVSKFIIISPPSVDPPVVNELPASWNSLF